MTYSAPVFAAIQRAKARQAMIDALPTSRDDAERERLARLARWQAPPLSRDWPKGSP